jgi:hypothetical protein
VKSKVAVIKSKPETVIHDIEILMEMAGFQGALPKNKITILKDNIPWHFPSPSVNMTPPATGRDDSGIEKAIKRL